MSQKNMRHPPKKKHSTKPRAAVVEPLSELEQLHRAEQSFQKCQMHLKEAEVMAKWGQAPNACIHSAYYAMYHCAISVLFANGGVGRRRSVPESHEHVLEHFGKLVIGLSPELAGLGPALSRARTDRTSSDYGLIESPDVGDVLETVDAAKHFVTTCTANWALDTLDKVSRRKKMLGSSE